MGGKALVYICSCVSMNGIKNPWLRFLWRIGSLGVVFKNVNKVLTLPFVGIQSIGYVLVGNYMYLCWIICHRTTLLLSFLHPQLKTPPPTHEA